MVDGQHGPPCQKPVPLHAERASNGKDELAIYLNQLTEENFVQIAPQI